MYWSSIFLWLDGEHAFMLFPQLKELPHKKTPFVGINDFNLAFRVSDLKLGLFFSNPIFWEFNIYLFVSALNWIDELLRLYLASLLSSYQFVAVRISLHVVKDRASSFVSTSLICDYTTKYSPFRLRLIINWCFQAMQSQMCNIVNERIADELKL